MKLLSNQKGNMLFRTAKMKTMSFVPKFMKNFSLRCQPTLHPKPTYYKFPEYTYNPQNFLKKYTFFKTHHQQDTSKSTRMVFGGVMGTVMALQLQVKSDCDCSQVPPKMLTNQEICKTKFAQQNDFWIDWIGYIFSWLGSDFFLALLAIIISIHLNVVRDIPILRIHGEPYLPTD